MPRRKSRTKRGPPEKAYNIISYQEVLGKEQKYLNHIGNLKKCLRAIQESTTSQREIEAKELLQQKWLDYVDCNPLPKAYIPSDIRLNVEKIKFFEDASIETTINWLLAVDERSILTQDIFAKDLTRQTLSTTIKPNFGYEYNDNVEYCLNILKRIQYFLLNEVEVKKCSLSMLKDIKELRWDIQNEIQAFFNRFTYRILSSEKSYMNSVDAWTSDYSFEGKHFQLHIWCLKNVPIRFKQMDEPYMIARMDTVKIGLQIPADVLELNFTLRVIHLDFDHVSERAISAFLELIEVHRQLSAEIEELPQSLLYEWQMQLNIQKRIRKEMTEKRMEYEEQLRAYIEQQEAAKRPAKEKEESEKGVKKKKIPKPTREPPLLTDDMYPDVFEDFLREEQSQFEEFLNLAYNPDYMDLSPDEINLKKYSILGGIFQIYKVTKPIHFDFDNFDITNHINGSELVIDSEALIKPFLKPSKSRIRPSVFASAHTPSKKTQDFKPVPDCPWYNLIIELPDYLCDWGEPIVCQYATIDKIKPKEGATQKLPSFAGKEVVKKGSVVGAVDVESTAQVRDSQPVKKEFLFSPSILNIKRPSKENFLRTSLSNIRFGKFDNLIEIPARDDQGVLNIQDFPLTNYLKKQQIRDIERHVVPRILSSFKFPKEILEDEILAESQKKSKGKGGVLVRKRGNVDDAGAAVRVKGFYFGPKQNNPEKVIALFPPVEDIRLFETIYDELAEEEGEEGEYRVRKKPESNDPKTFIDLLRITNNIKWGYKLRIRKLLDLKPFPLKKKINLVNKRIDVLVKKIRRGSFAEAATQTLAVMEDRTSTAMKEDADTVEKDTSILPEKEEKKGPEEQQQQQHQSKQKKKKKVVEKEEKEEEEPPETYSYDCWTTKYILKSDFDREKRQIQIQTDRLGYFGLAFKMYEHFPFKFWKLEPNPENPENELIFTLDTQFVRCILNISEKGIKGCVTEPSTKFIRNPRMYLVLEEPISDYIEFKRMFKEKFLNIFADNDACYYIENGYFCQKHLATEFHTYNCMAINCTQIKFSFSQWNRLSKRRDILLKFLQYQDLEENTVEVRITPEEAWFVETTELCSDDVDVINLSYNLTWRNLTTSSDLNYLINSMYLAAHEMRCKNPKLIHTVRSLLSEIRPLSFS